MSNKIITLSGCSGAGKGSIIEGIMQDAYLGDILQKGISTTTRAPRENKGVWEKDGVDYRFVTLEKMQQLIEDNLTVEHEIVYPADAASQGIPKIYAMTVDALKKVRDQGKVPILDLDVKGGASIKKHYPHALQIFVDPQASYDAIMKRLVDRGKLSMEDIQNRLARMPEEMKIGKTFDHTVFNPDGGLQNAIEHAKYLIRSYVAAA